MTKFYPIIKRFKRSAALRLITILTMFSGGLFAQAPAQVNINVTVSPPYSPFYADYAGSNASKVLLIVQNLSSTQKKIKLTGQLNGDNGIRISTKSTYVPLQPIILNPNETKQLNGLALKDIFDLNTLNVYGIDKVKLVQTSRLPEGNYSFCIQAVDMTNNQVISSSAPLGCSFISIIYPDAPVLVNPFANSSIPAVTGQSFVWQNNLSQPITVMYQFQVAEMPDERKDPNQILNATSWLKIDRTIVNSISTTLLPSDPPLTEGKRYAWRVIASDPSGKIIFKNNGISGANEFRYGEKPYIASTFQLNTPKENMGVKNLDSLIFNWTFTDNSSKNDKIGFYDGPVAMNNNFGALQYGATAWGNTTAKYQLHIVRVKTAEELKAEKRAGIGNVSGKSNIPKDNGITIGVNSETIDFKSTPAMAAYIKDGNNYSWQLKHVTTGTLSDIRTFTVKYVKEIPSFTMMLAGNLQYNFNDSFFSGIYKAKQKKTDPNVVLTEVEKGLPLANKSIQVLKVTLLAPTYKVTKQFKGIENGVEKIYSEQQDSIASLSDLAIYPNGFQKVATATVVASGTTDIMGNFKIEVPIQKSQYRVLDAHVKIPGRNTEYALVEGLVIRVNDTRFSDPNWYVVPNSDNTDVLLDQNTVEAYSYKLNANLSIRPGRAYRGKLYLLRDESKLVKGEVENMTGVKKDLPIYKTITAASGKIVVMPNGTTSYTVVGVNDIDVSAGATQNASTFIDVAGTSFQNLVAATDGGDQYTLYYEPSNDMDALYYSPQKVSSIGGKKVTYESTDWAKTNVVEKATFAPRFISLQIKGRYTYNWKEANGKTNPKLPLPEGTILNLVQGNLEQTGFASITSSLTKQKSIATTTVKKNGEYTFDVGLTDYKQFNANETLNLVVVIQSDYYFSEAHKIIYDQNEDITVPELNATVRQFSYISKIGYKNGSNLNLKAGMEVYLCRKLGEKGDVDRPANIGDPGHDGYFKKIWEHKIISLQGNQFVEKTEKYEIIDRATSSGAEGHIGEFTFKRLVVPKSVNEKYYIFSEPMSTSQENYITKDAFDLTTALNFDGVKQMAFTDGQKVLLMDYNTGFAHVPVVPLVPYIDGAVYPNSDASTSVLSGVHAEMFDMTGVSGTITETQIVAFLSNPKVVPEQENYTKTNGRFLFEDVNKKAKGWKLLRFTKQGFLPTYVKVNDGKILQNGDRGNLQKVLMNLPKDIVTTIVDDQGNRVAARIIVGDDFSWADYTPGGAATILKSPYGSVNFTIIPVDRALYKTTEVVKTVFNTTNFLTLIVNKNQHTIIVKCYKKGTKTLLGANVTVLNAPNFKEFAPDNYMGRGPMSVITIPSGGTQFDLRVVPKDINYTIAKTQVLSNGLDIVEVEVYVEPAVSIKIKGLELISAAGGLFDAKALNGDFNAYVEGFDDDEYITSKSQQIVYSAPKASDVIDMPKTNQAPKTIPPVKKEEPVEIIKPTKPIKIIKIGAVKKVVTKDPAITNEVVYYASAVQTTPEQAGINYFIQPDGSSPLARYNSNDYQSDDANDFKDNQASITSNNSLSTHAIFSETIVTITISRLPANRTFTITGAKADYIGSKQPINPNGANNAMVDLIFRKSPDINVNSMYGFPIEITQLTQPGASGQYLISGKLKLAANSQSSNIKSKTSSDKLEFSNVLVQVNKAASGQAKDNYLTIVNEMYFAQNSIDAKLFNSYEVKVISKNGLSLRPITPTTASLSGSVAIDPVSFSKGVSISGAEDEGNANYLYLNEKGKKYSDAFTAPQNKKTSVFYTFSTAKSDLTAPDYFVSTINGYLPTFKGADHITVVPNQNVLFTSGGILFEGTLSTNLANAVTRNIKAQGTFYLNNQGFYSYSQKAFSVKLRNWDLNVSSWEYGTTGLSTKGTLNTLGLSIPFSSLMMNYDKIGFGVFSVSELKLLNKFPVTINNSGATVSFGFDKGYSKDGGAWSVSVLANGKSESLASLRGLPDLGVGDEIKIKNINLYDTNNENDTRLILTEEQAPVTLNLIAKFKPNTVWGSSSFITFRGGLDMQIPGFTGLDEVTYDLTYRVDATGKFVHNHENPFQNLGLDSKGMQVTFYPTDQRFTNGELYLKGYLKDKDPSGKYRIEVELLKNKTFLGENVTKLSVINGAKIYMEEGDRGKIEASYLNNAYGSSKIVNNQWEYFTFGGDMTGANGVDPSPMNFTIKGDVVANSSQLGVNNMDAGGVKGLSIIYDFGKHALIGSGHIKQATSFASLDLDVELNLGASTWYILSSGLADVNYTPFKSIGVGFMVGNATLNEAQKNIFYKHFGGTDLPESTKAAFSEVKGVLLMLSAEMPIPILPTFDLDLDPVAHCEFKHGIYASAYFKADFNKDPSSFALTVGGRAGAFVKLGAGASIGLACAGISLSADTHADIKGYVQPLKGIFSAEAMLTFTLQGSAYVGAGVCNSSCETPCVSVGLFDVCSPIPCIKTGLSKTLVLGIGAGVDNNGFRLLSQSKTYQ
jgi:hypothetical protein